MVIQLHLTLLLLSIFTSSTTPLTFNFSTFPDDIPSLFIEGDAKTDGNRLRLNKTPKEPKLSGNVGRATYTEPFLLRGNVSGKLTLADFTTHFTFVVDSQGNLTYGDGFVFFLAPKGSKLHSKLGYAGKLGLPVRDLPGESEYPFVAVEFDTHHNPPPNYLDPPYDHVGVDINNLRSNKTTQWRADIPNAQINNASVSYNSTLKTLEVAFTSLVNDTSGIQRQMISYLSCMVDLAYLPDWVIVGFSSGTGGCTAVHEIISWNFTSTSIVDEFVDDKNPTGATTPQASPNPNTIDDQKSRDYNILRISMGLVVGLSILVLALVWFIFLRKRKKVAGSNVEDSMMVLDGEFIRGTGPIKFMYSDLARATNDFDEGEKIGEGGFGGVYRGFIEDLNTFVAIKRVSKGSKQGLKEYVAEVKIVGRLRHRNLVQLVGWCHENGDLLLVYELMLHGSLDSYLFNEGGLLKWELRYKIALGLGNGVLYLHEECEQCILHRDIKASNVMLDMNFNVKLGDFGLARLVEHEKGSVTTMVAGTRGYMALDYVVTGKASKESDVYSFGVVALEIACGRKSMDFDLENSRVNLVEWVWGLYGEGRLIEASDPKLCGDFDERQMECLMIVGLWCAHPDYSCRPPVQQAIQVLNFHDQLPSLPSIMPAAPSLTRQVMTGDDTISGSEIGQEE